MPGLMKHAGVLLFIICVTGWTGIPCGRAAPDSITVGTATELTDAVAAANSGGPRTILLEDGVYTLSEMLWVSADGVLVRSISGNRNAVIIEGQGMTGGVSHIFNVPGSHFTASDMTLRKVANHAIQIHGNADSDAPVLKNLRIQDTFEQMIKVSYESGNPAGSDNGIMENCLLEYTAGIGPQWYIGGIDVHQGRNWIIRNNIFQNIRSPGGDVAEHAIHFWSDSEGTLAERNLIINCDRGIGYGLGSRGHTGGIIRNNMIFHDSTEGFADVGIAVETCPDVQIYNNTIFMENSYPNAIEYRFTDTTGVFIANNLTNRAITARDGATGTLTHNITTALAAWFESPAGGNLHLSSPVPDVVDSGITINGLIDDYDGHSRPAGAGIDIGADEYDSVPAEIILNLILNQSYLTPGDRFHLQLTLGNNGPTVTLDLYIALQVGNHFFFWPGWSRDIEFQNTELPQGYDSTDTLLDFIWPDGAGSFQDICFWAVLLDPGTGSVAVPPESECFDYGY